MKGDKDTYVYIAGSGRSGSTVLEAALSSHPEILGAGEIARLPHALRDRPKWSMPRRCACDALMNECPVWGPILREARKLDFRSMSLDEWQSFLLPKLQASKPGAHVIVDSSNWTSPLRSMLRSRLKERFSIKVIYLTRDVRGFVNSASVRGYAQGENTEWHHPVWRAAAGWWIRNKVMIRMFRQLDRDMRMHLPYERFTADARRVLRETHKFIGVEQLDLSPTWMEQTLHTFAGNRLFRKSSSSEIREDLGWRYELGPTATALVEVIAGRLSRKLMKGL